MFGGDSWDGEAHQRKRRVDDLITQTIDSSAFTNLSNGKFTCIVCPHYPTIDTSLMLSAHMKGSRHLAAAAKLQEKEVARTKEMNKRIALSDDCSVISRKGICSREKKTTQPPLISKTRRVASEVIGDKSLESSAKNERRDMQSYIGSSFSYSPATDEGTSSISVASTGYLEKLQNSRELPERELKFTAAGWKRDGHGRWFKDENAEFDSDEEDPNEYFAH